MIDAILSKYLTPSWRTTLGGFATLCIGVGSAVNEVLAGHWPSPPTLAAIAGGWTLMFAKDEKAKPEAK